MKSLDEIINESTDPREVKRALSVKMIGTGITPAMISELLNVSLQYISKWKGMYEVEGAEGLVLGYQGSQGYLTDHDREAVILWINDHATLSVEALRDYLEVTYAVIYQSKQSYYELLDAGGMSYHKSEKVNPKRDEAQVQARRDAIKKNWTPNGTPSSGVRS